MCEKEIEDKRDMLPDEKFFYFFKMVVLLNSVERQY